ncbi:MAG: hypothetical protein E6H96_05510 [Chloroflexi bacterium]|nr:MAG: hypothetical protein E6H96_05510 [Chloroflexota bacterium]
MRIIVARPCAAQSLGAILAVLALVLLPAIDAAGANPRTGFSVYSLAGTPPAPVGTSCPGQASDCTNYAAEPAIRAAADGTFYASSENGLGGGTLAWKSTDGGLHYATVPSPNNNSATQDTGFAPGGGDTDLAIAPIRNASGNYNVYVSSLTLANVDVSTSTDDGASWTLNPIGATVPGDDREWVAADGVSKVCVSYHDLAFNLWVNCSYNAGTSFTQLADAFDANHAWLVDANSTGNLAIDPASHIVYQTFSGPRDAAGTVACGGFTCLNVVYMAVSTDGGRTFNDRQVYANPDQNVAYGHQFTNVSIDAAGNVYSVFSDNHNIFYSWSSDRGMTWSTPRQVNKNPSTTAIMPWSVAGGAGKIDIVWYGTSYYDGTNPPDNYPSSASWYVYFAQNLTAVSNRSSFTQQAATPIVHFGGVCLSGIACTGNRDLYDDFGVAANPLTGLASIVYSDDQYRNDTNNAPSSGCTPAKSNSGICDHTAIATQLSGKSIR